MIKVMLVDDHPLFREGVIARLSMSDEISVVAEAENGRQAIAQIDTFHPDVILMDINMPEMNGMEALEVIAEKYESINILMLSMHDDKEYVLNVIRAGASGYILKDISGDEMIRAIKSVFKGDKYFSQEVATILAQQDSDNTQNVLTMREQLVLRLISHGLNNKKIAQELDISVRTVETHKRNITKKLDINTTSGLVRYAIEYGLDK